MNKNNRIENFTDELSTNKLSLWETPIPISHGASMSTSILILILALGLRGNRPPRQHTRMRADACVRACASVLTWPSYEHVNAASGYASRTDDSARREPLKTTNGGSTVPSADAATMSVIGESDGNDVSVVSLTLKIRSDLWPSRYRL